jgi:hypothetical protein
MISKMTKHKLIRWRRAELALSIKLILSLILLVTLNSVACSGGKSGDHKAEAEEEAESRTEFTDRVENFFEYDPLKAGKSSHFLIHLTDLSDGSPVEKADVTLTIRSKDGSTQVGETKAKVGKVTGIYVAELTIPNPGDYNIEFHIKNAKLDESIPLTDFKVE